MDDNSYVEIAQHCQQLLTDWLASCTRHGKLARNTVAIGVVVLNHLRRACPVARDQVVSGGGEISGSRSALGRVLAEYEIPVGYLKEVTTRQAHPDGQRLFDLLNWGHVLDGLSEAERDVILLDLIAELKKRALEHLRRENLRPILDRRQAPTTWVAEILDSASGRSGGIVEQHLVGAKLERRFANILIPNHPAHAADVQTERLGDFAVSDMVYHITSAPTRNVIQKCADNIRNGLRPILLVTRSNVDRARFLAEQEKIDRELLVASIEDFVALNIVELATDENKDLYAVMIEVIEAYNRRLADVETDLSLTIQLT